MKRIFPVVVFLLAAVFSPSFAYAATMVVVSSPSSVSAGDMVTARVVVNPFGTAINNAEARLNFSSDVLQVVSVSKGSLFSLWVEEPSYSGGSVSFNGGVPNPGVSSAGTALTVSFRALKTGTASLSLSNAAVRANDGFGTDVLTGVSGSQVQVVAAAPVKEPVKPTIPATKPVETSGSLDSTDITSSSHPNQDKWYPLSTATFAWSLPEEASGVEIGIDTSPDTLPKVAYAGLKTKKTVEDLDDGTWYFRMRYKLDGEWSKISSYRVQVDTEEPEIASQSFVYDESSNKVLVTVEATDSASGIEWYDVVIDGGKVQHIPASEFAEGSKAFPARKSGIHQISVTAIDYAQNSSSVEGTFSVPESFGNKELFSIGGIGISLASVLIGMTLLSLLSLALAFFAWSSLLVRRSRVAQPLRVGNKSLHHELLKLKGSLEADIRSLDRARLRRTLSREEMALHRRIIENVKSLEQYLKDEE